MAKVFTRRLVHLIPVRTDDGAGGYTETWSERGAHWGEVRMRSGALKATDFGRTPRLQVRIQLREVPQDHPARPWPGHRLRDGARIFSVEAVQESDRRARYLTVLANEVPREEITE
ncbi:MAG: head-tail adaptor protein [Jannaschia sp.]